MAEVGNKPPTGLLLGHLQAIAHQHIQHLAMVGGERMLRPGEFPVHPRFQEQQRHPGVVAVYRRTEVTLIPGHSHPRQRFT